MRIRSADARQPGSFYPADLDECPYPQPVIDSMKLTISLKLALVMDHA